MSYLGIDFGIKRIGVAISYYGVQAEPLGVFTQKEIIKKIIELVKKHGVKKIIFGKTEGNLFNKAKKLSGIIEKITDLEIEYSDETLSSQEAQEILISSDVGRKKRNKKLDAYAACLILENYLEQKNEKSVNRRKR